MVGVGHGGAGQGGVGRGVHLCCSLAHRDDESRDNRVVAGCGWGSGQVREDMCLLYRVQHRFVGQNIFVSR